MDENGIDERDRLISRVVDGAASSKDWAAFRQLAARDPSVWQELASSQHDQDQLEVAVEEELAIADWVDAPVEQFHTLTAVTRLRSVGVWGGWAAAAALLLGWMTTLQSGWPTAPSGGPTQAGLVPTLQPENSGDALQTYLTQGAQEGRVIREIPQKVLVETRYLGEGQGVDVLYIRQILERTRFDTLYQFEQDELGRPAGLVPYRTHTTSTQSPL